MIFLFFIPLPTIYTFPGHRLRLLLDLGWFCLFVLVSSETSHLNSLYSTCSEDSLKHFRVIFYYHKVQVIYGFASIEY